MQSLMGGGKIMNGVHWDQYADASGDTYGTELAPAILGVWLNTAFTCGSSLTLAQGLAAANGQLAAGGIVLINWVFSAAQASKHSSRSMAR